MGLDPAGLSTVRPSRERLDHVGLLGERHPGRVLAEYVTYPDGPRPHQGTGQGAPISLVASDLQQGTHEKEAVIAVPVLGGLPHAYRPAA